MLTTYYLESYVVIALVNAVQPTHVRDDCNIARCSLSPPSAILVLHGVYEGLPNGSAELLTEKLNHFSPS